MSANGCMRKSTRKRIQQHRDDARRTEARRTLQAQPTDAEKEAAVMTVLLSDRRDEFLQVIANARTPHEQQHLAYHEGGHALMEMLFYMDLVKVSIAPSFHAESRRLFNAVTEGISKEGKTALVRGPDYDGNDARVDAFLIVREIMILLAGSTSEKQFCSCGWNPDGDGYDREDLQNYYEEV